ncbi:MAG: RluA family pseudouridine synthase [Verrucomicrobiota bacterium]|nr:MAG: RluA family pseudouridine synthase [Verrucomicrobiota bacterium]
MATLTVPTDIIPDRCDKILAQLLKLPRSVIKSATAVPFERNGQKITPHDFVYPGDTIIYELPTIKAIAPAPVLELSILFEDEDLIVIDKPANIAVHPAPGFLGKTLVEYVLDHCPLSYLGEKDRPGVVHRLDKETTGCIVFAKSNRAFKQLSRDFAEHNIQKQYMCIIHGNPPLQTGTIEVPIGRKLSDKTRMAAMREGKYAKTTWVVRKRFKQYAWLDVRIWTGRTHQIRVHLSYKGWPIVGDTVYGSPSNKLSPNTFPRIMLHAESLTFSHPRIGLPITCTAPIPDDFTEVLRTLKPSP